MATVIKVENVSKQYRLGNVGSGTLRDDITRWWYRMRGKEDPLMQLGSTNDRTQKADSDYVWALKDINFEVQQGDVLGIIGRNGAGKSTLLKILSKTTAPTTGSVKVKGRIASLLEVGTGFHPELTGRENIYLNGAILGMRKHEITRKLDEIVDFAGVERYIDTPVKRYSSGMYVRLAFGVAAHLESEILIIDEVLAVGDAEFQKKCLGKMSEVSKGEGRTVLFVSHNMAAVQKLCTSAILMRRGITQSIGAIKEVIDHYTSEEFTNSLAVTINPAEFTELQTTNGYIEKVSFEDLDGNKLDFLPFAKKWQIRVRFSIVKPKDHFIVSMGIVTSSDIPVYTTWSEPSSMQPGQYEAVFVNDAFLFSAGNYRLTVGLSNHEISFHSIEGITTFTVADVKDYHITNNKRILRLSGAGFILNPIPVNIQAIRQ
jgi:lipopolysaccharide transport system ATP-binding protein